MFPNSMLRHPKADQGTSAVRVWNRNGTLASEQIWPKRGPKRQMQVEEGHCHQKGPKQVQSKSHVVSTDNMSQWECKGKSKVAGGS